MFISDIQISNKNKIFAKVLLLLSALPDLD